MVGWCEGEAVSAERLAVLGMEGRAGEEAEVHRIEVVTEAGEGDLGGLHRSASNAVALEHADRPAATGEVHGGRERIMPRANENGVELHGPS